MIQFGIRKVIGNCLQVFEGYIIGKLILGRVDSTAHSVNQKRPILDPLLHRPSKFACTATMPSTLCSLQTYFDGKLNLLPFD